MIEKLIGKKNEFAIEINSNPVEADINVGKRRIWLNEKPIIKKEEISYLPTFNFGLEKIKNKVNELILWNSRFEGKTDLEMFKLIRKSKTYIDSLEGSKFKVKNIVLGGSDDDEYFKHLINIDETTDQYLIFITVNKGIVKFLWKCSDVHNCQSEEFNKFETATVPLIELNKTINEYLDEYK